MTFREPTFAGELCTTTNDLRLMQAGMVCSEGVGGFDQLAVTATDPVSGAVTISAGHAFVANDNGAGHGGMYHVYNDAPVELDVPLNGGGVARTDVVWIQVCDSEYGGVSAATPVYDDNNPTATPPADGCTYYLLATVVVPNGAGAGGTPISGTPTTWNDTDGMITDERSAYSMCGGLREVVKIEASTTFEKADYPWARYAKVTCVGGGGAGGIAPANAGAGDASVAGGGGGADCAESLLEMDALAASVSVTIGDPGDGGTASAGTDTTFGAHVVAKAGSFGLSSASTAGNSYGLGGAPGAGSIGQVIRRGQRGGSGAVIGGSGGVIPFGVGGHGGGGFGTGGAPAFDAPGGNAAQYGAGGGGGSNDGVGGAKDGGDGAPGVCIIELFG